MTHRTQTDEANGFPSMPMHYIGLVYIYIFIHIHRFACLSVCLSICLKIKRERERETLEERISAVHETVGLNMNCPPYGSNSPKVIWSLGPKALKNESLEK